MPVAGDVQTHDGTNPVWQKYVTSDFGVGLSSNPAHRFVVAAGTAPSDIETYFKPATQPFSGANGWILHKKSKDGPSALSIDWQVNGKPTWGIGQDYDTNNSGNANQGGTGNSDFVILYDYTVAKNERQRVTRGTHTGGTFKLTFEGQQTGDIQWNASADDVKTALEALSNLAVGDVAVTSIVAGTWNVTFQGAKANQNVGFMTMQHSLTGGSGQAVILLLDGGPGADILRVSPAEESQNTSTRPGEGPKFYMSHIAGSPRGFGDFFTCEAGRGLGGIHISCFHPNPSGGGDSVTYRNHINLGQRNNGSVAGASANQRCIINFQGNSSVGLWQVGTDFFNSNAKDFYFWDGTNNRTRLFLKSTAGTLPNIGFGTSTPPDAITTHATSSALTDKQQVGMYVGYNNTLNNRGIYAVQVLDATTDIRYLFLGGGFDDGMSAGTRANPKFKSTSTATWALMGHDSLFAIQTAPIGSNQAPVTGLAMDTSGRVGIGLTTMTAALHVKAGAASANGAPLKVTSGTNLTTTEQGAVEYDGSRLSFTPGASAGTSTRRAVALSSDHMVATAQVKNTVSETTVFTGTIAAGEMAVGKTFKVRLLGRYTTANATDRFTIRCKVGSTTLTELAVTSAQKLIPTNAPTPLDLEFVFTCRTTGASGSVRGDVRATLDHVDLSKPATADTTGIDTTSAQNVTITVDWDAAHNDNAVNIGQGFLTVLN